MYLIIIFIPLINFLYLSFFGRYLGRYGSMVFVCFYMILTVIFSIIAFLDILTNKNIFFIILGDWINIDMLTINWGFIIDGLTIIMFLVVTIISTIVHIYSFSYMFGDPHLSRFLSYLSLFTFFMLILVSADNFLQLFLGWEGVGLCSYLLISFWFTRIQANKAAIKAMVINRIGDFGLFLGILLTFFTFKTLDFYNVFLLIPYLKHQNIIFFGISFKMLHLLAFFFFIGAIGKSAQVGLHTWLPDAMEGPTPVSALIHAATMVTAGIFLIIRCSILFEYAPYILTLCTFIGATTAFFAATTGMLQNDIKKVIAYSTCSQLGYMFFICGLSNYSLSFFHLFNHAFFKALLFLGAGSLIHSLNSEQDMRVMGGLLGCLPLTYTLIIVGSFALMGFPFLAGFYSKDIILEIALVTYTISSKFAYILGTISAFFTAFYSFRIILLVFIKKNNSFKYFIKNIHEMDFLTACMLSILGVGSIFSGYVFKDLFIGLGSDFFSTSIYNKPSNIFLVDAEFMPYTLKIIPTIFSLLGCLFSILCYYLQYSFLIRRNLTLFGIAAYKFLNQKWYFDYIYNYFVGKKILYFCYYYTFSIIDKGVVELFGPKGLIFSIYTLGKKSSNYSTGFLYNYTCIFLISFIFYFFLVS